MSNKLENGLTYFGVAWEKNKDSSTSSETTKNIEFADFTTPGQSTKANITNFDDLSRWLNNTESWIKDSLEKTAGYRETIVNNIWTKHQKVPYSQFPPNIQETLTKLKKQDILTDLDSLTFEMARVLTVLDAANLFNKPTFSFVAVGANYDNHKLSFDVTLDSFPWNENTKVRLTTETSQLYAYFTSVDKTTINFQINDSYDAEAKELVKNFKRFQTVQLTRGA